jgi:homoserine dehydrogenase
MSNKGPIALYSSELLELAKKNNVELRFEGTVMSGTPAINLGQTRLMGSHISAIHGIMNGTTNYILTEMEKGLDYEIALKQAQELGYAEADPTADVEGHDALAKIVILANVVFGKRLDKSQVPCEGITEITQRHIETAKEEGKRWKLIASAKQTDEGAVEAYVKLVKLPLDNPLTSISGTTNAITYSTKYLGDVTIIGPGAGKTATGFALLSDLLDLHRIYSR